jgi:hypothetical protein
VLTAGGALVALLLRATHWWRRPLDGFTVRRGWIVAIGVCFVGLSGASFFADIAIAVAAVLTTVVAVVTTIKRRGKPTRWSPARALAVASLVQMADTLVIVDRWLVPDGAHGAFNAAVIAVVAGMLLVAFVVLVLLPAVTYLIALGWPRATAEAWGRLGGAAQIALPFLVAAALVGSAWALHSSLARDIWRAAVIAGMALPGIVGAVFLVDWARRHSR